MELTEQVVIKAVSFEDAKSKLNKFVKRGATNVCRRSDAELLRWVKWCGYVYVTVYSSGKAAIHNHDCQPAAVLKRVRDVENYRVK